MGYPQEIIPIHPAIGETPTLPIKIRLFSGSMLIYQIVDATRPNG